MSSSALPTATAAARSPRPALDALFGDVWPDATLPGSPRRLVAAVGVGLLAAVVLPFREAGIGTFVVLTAVCGVVASADRRLRTPYHASAGVLGLLLVATVFVRDAEWVVALCLLAAFAVGVCVLTEGRSLPGLLASAFAIPLAALRGLPWLGRSLARTGRPTSTRWVPAVRTLGVSVLLVLVFGLLFASADALFATWAGALVPDVTLDTFFLRSVVLLATAGLTLTGVYVALNPPQVERLAMPEARAVARRFEWLVPVGGVVVVFSVFVAAQLTVMFGGHAYLRRTTGLTYAAYVHEGFGQLTVTTLLTLIVVGVAARKASWNTVRDRLLLRAVLGALCVLALVVVASALYRIHVYEQAYGFTRLRMLVSFFEAWLGLVLLLVIVAGVLLSGRWVPRAVLLTGAATLLALAALNPDAYIARQNLDRYQETSKVDAGYLAGLSADAVPTLATSGLTQPCTTALDGREDDWLEWNLGRWRASDVTCR
jgi:two-component system sensor histidine kinase BaeS